MQNEGQNLLARHPNYGAADIAPKMEEQPANQKTFYSRYIRFLMRDSFVDRITLKILTGFWLTGPTVPLSDPLILQRALKIYSFLKGFRWITEEVWPLILFISMLHDFSVSLPNERENVFWNLPLNESYLTRTLGAETPIQPFFWVGFLMLIFIPFIAGVWNIFQNKSWLQNSETDLNPNLPEGKLCAYNLKLLSLFIPASPLRNALHQKIWSILWDRRTNSHARRQLLSELESYEPVFLKYLALSTLAKIADSFRQRDLEKIETDENKILEYRGEARNALVNLAPEQLNISAYNWSGDSEYPTALLSVQEEAKKTLCPSSEKISSYFSYFFSQYLLWTLGENITDKRLAILFGFYAFFKTFFLIPFVIYSQIRYIQIFSQKFIDILNYFYFNPLALKEAAVLAQKLLQERRESCEALNKVFTHVAPLLADYTCSFCGDWSFVYYNEIFSSQTCLDGLLGSSLSVSEVLNKITRFSRSPDLQKIDLSGRNWTGWNIQDLQSFLTGFQNIQGLQLNIFNLSKCHYDGVIFQRDERYHLLSNFLQKVPVKFLSLKNLGLISEILSDIFPRGSLPFLEGLEVDGNNLDDKSINTLGSLISSGNISYFSGNQNLITDAGLITLSSWVNQSSLVTFRIGQNPWGDNAFKNALLPILQNNRNIEYIDISSALNNLLISSMQLLGSSLKNIRLKSLIMRSAGLTNEHIFAFSQGLPHSSLQQIDWRGNTISNSGFLAFFYYAQNSSLNKVSFSNNPIGDEGVCGGIIYLSKAHLQELDISGFELSNVGWRCLTANFPKFLKTFRGNNMLISEEDFQLLSTVLLNSPQLQKIVLSSVQMTDQSGAYLFDVLPRTNVTDIDFSGNLLTGQSAQRLSNLATTHKLKRINLSNNNLMKGSDFYGFFNNLSHTKIEIIILNGITLGDEEAAFLASRLITGRFNPSVLTAPILSNVTRQAIEEAKPNTLLKEVDLSNCGLSNHASHAFCEILPQANISFSNFITDENPQFNLRACQIPSTSSGNRLSPWPYLSTLIQYFVNYIRSGSYFDRQHYPRAAFFSAPDEKKYLKETPSTKEKFIGNYSIDKLKI